ncbi:MAG: methyltransferase domain-containing protein [Chloroflexi bacterium]|nr:methyltransferase domain-containing protein [Chloroflexota bacterium]
MGSEPGFRAARRWLLDELGLRDGTSVLEGGCGTGVALPDLLEVGGHNLQVLGVDPTQLFVDRARARVEELGAAQAAYQLGDIRALPYDDDAALDAAFCEKVLIHVGPVISAVSEMLRVVRPGGRVGAIEWYPQFVLSTTEPAHETALNAMFRSACNDYTVAPNLARHLRSVGLEQVRVRTSVTSADNLDEHPFWRAFLIDQLPMFVHAQVLEAAVAEALATDLERLSAEGNFHASFVIRAGYGVKP